MSERGRSRRGATAMFVGSAALIVLAVASASARQQDGPPWSRTGADWKAYGSAERQAYLNGFLAGAAAEQAALAPPAGDGPRDSVAPSAAIAKLAAAKQLHFPYAPSVYSVQLDDYFWYTDRATTPIVDAMAGINKSMLNPDVK